MKKVSRTANQLQKFQLFSARAAQADYRASLKQVAKKEFTLEEDDSNKKIEKPEWVERTERTKSMPRTSNSEPVSGAVSEYEEEEEIEA